MKNYIGYIKNPNKRRIILNFDIHECKANDQPKRWKKQNSVSFIN